VNLREGTRRLALFLAVIGTVIGIYGSFKELQTIWLHNKFEALENSEVVQQEAKAYFDDVQKERAKYLLADRWYKGQISSLDMSSLSSRVKNTYQVDRLALGSSNTLGDSLDKMRQIERYHTELNKAGIKAIHWTHDYGIDSLDASVQWPRHLEVERIDTYGGDTFQPTKTPSVWSYLLVVIFPVLGFWVPWSVVRGVEWAFLGFAKS